MNNNTQKHTPGPFEISNVYGSSSSDYSQFTLTIRTKGCFPIEQMTSLVGAVPELLEALREATTYLANDRKNAPVALTRWETAIALAEGRA